jgi:prevent-host-death family protein
MEKNEEEEYRYPPLPEPSYERWQIQEAKARFSCVVESTKRGYQMITKNSQPVAVMMSKKEFDRLTKPKKSLLDLFRDAPCQDVELPLSRLKDAPRDFEL